MKRDTRKRNCAVGFILISSRIEYRFDFYRYGWFLTHGYCLATTCKTYYFIRQAKD